MSPRLGRPRLGSKSSPADLDGVAAAAPDTAQESVASEAAAWAAGPAGDAEAPADAEVPADAEAPAADAPDPAELAQVAAAPSEPEAPAAITIAEGLVALATYQRAVLSWVAEDSYPVNVDIEIEVKPGEGIVRFGEPAGFHIPSGTTVAITGSHITLLPSGGFGERRHVTAWGVASARPRARFAVNVTRVWAWDEEALPLPAAYERGLRKARRYFERLSAERGERIRPKLPRRLLLLRATRAPFLSATFAPVLLGLAVAARVGVFDALTAVITVVAASAVHLGLNVANDVFDTLQGADDANATPTKFSGGSRVLQNALVTISEMSMLAAGCYLVAAILGVALFVMRGSPALIVIVIIGFFISLAYTMPPFKLVYRGLGEIATAIGFGPIMLLGAYVVQSRGSLRLEAFVVSIPVALLVAMILYVNEIPDRAGDAKAGKRTLPVRWSKAAVVAGFDLSAAGSFVAVAVGVAAGVLPIPALLALLAIPLALRVHEGLVRFYDNPYALMSAMGANIQLHMAVGSLLLVGYVLTIADQTWLGRAPFLW